MGCLAKTDQIHYEDFSVLDSAGDLLPGITLTEFSADLYDETGAASGITVSFSELGGGHYRASFTPDDPGIWYLIVYHATHFPAGKSGTIEVYNADFDSIETFVEAIRDIEYGRWQIVSDQMVFYKADNVTEIARFDLTYNVHNIPIERTKV
jgi:hypothetical protein